MPRGLGVDGVASIIFTAHAYMYIHFTTQHKWLIHITVLMDSGVFNRSHILLPFVKFECVLVLFNEVVSSAKYTPLTCCHATFSLWIFDLRYKLGFVVSA